MKPSRKAFFILALISLLLSAFFANRSWAKDFKANASPMIIRDAELLDANQIAMWIMNNCTNSRHPVTGSAGFYYPRGTENTCIYMAGLWFAGKVSGELRTACSDYNVEYQPGKILPNGNPDNPELEKYRIYKIKPGDSADPNDPNYNRDYAEWPLEDGAPVDANGNPLIIGDQTLWCVMNDGDQSLHNSCYNTNPLNLEVQLLAWAFDDDSPLGKTVFLQYTIINTSQQPIVDAYVGLAMDPDLGNAVDDGSACDTTLNMTYVYNRGNVDLVYGAEVPALGVCLLRGPVVPSPGQTAFQFLHAPIPNARNLNLTANTVYY